MKRIADFLAGSLTGMLAGVVLALVLLPHPMDWSKEPLPTPRPSQHADSPHRPGEMTTERVSPLPSPDVAGRTGTPEPASPTPAPTTRTRPASTRAPRTSTTLRGTASWYCLPGRSACTAGYPADGLYAAAGPALRVGNWRGRVVTVERADGSAAVRVRLVDACACGGGRVIDLYALAFGRLAPLSAGVVEVRVRW